MTVFGGRVLFDGLDSNTEQNHWVTDGTAAGTHELTRISGADPTGLNPYDMTVLKGKVLFAGQDASGNYGLWVTGGTAASTHELTTSGAGPRR
jgi:ELWxxDGT repeat protein